MRKLPPAEAGWYDAPLGINGVEPTFVRTIGGRTASNAAPNQRTSTNDGASTSSNMPGNVNSPIDRDTLQRMIDEVVAAHLDREMRGRMPSLANEIRQTVKQMMQSNMPSMVSDALFDIAQQVVDEQRGNANSSSVRTRLLAIRAAQRCRCCKLRFR